MKKNIFISFLSLFFAFSSFGQTDRELLMEVLKQQAVSNAKIEAMDKRFDALQKQIDVRFEATDKRFESIGKRFDDSNKRIDILLYVMLGIMGGVFGLIGFVVWDRQASIKPVLQENKELTKEIEKILQKELILEGKLDNYIKKIAQIDPHFTGIL